MATNIKITALSDITSANMTYNDLVAVVDMNGTAETKKGNLQLVGNLILAGSGGSYFAKAAQATNAETVSNGAQPAITSVGTLTAVTVTGNVAAGNVTGTGGVFTYVSGDGANLTNLPSGSNSAAIANGTSNINIPSVNGNINTSVAGNANILIITGTGANVTGTLNASGIITGIGSGLSALAGANVSGTVPLATSAGTITTAAQPNITSTGTLTALSVTGNVGAGNVNAVGIVTQTSNSVAFGNTAGSTGQGDKGTAVGYQAGQTSQGIEATAIGLQAGRTSQGNAAVAIGSEAGEFSQGFKAVAIGSEAGESNQGNYSVAVGEGAGETYQSTNSVAIGNGAGSRYQGVVGSATDGNAIAIGTDAGRGLAYFPTYLSGDGTTTLVVDSTVGILPEMFIVGTGYTSKQRVVTVVNDTTLTMSAVNETTPSGTMSFYAPQNNGAVAIGLGAGGQDQQNDAVAIGYYAGERQDDQAIAIGNFAGQSGVVDATFVSLAGTTLTVSAPSSSIRVGMVITGTGFTAGQTIVTKNSNTEFVISAAAAGATGTLLFTGTPQGSKSIAIGQYTGQFNQARDSIAIGHEAGGENQGQYAVAIGRQCADNSQGQSAIAIGYQAGTTSQGANSIAIGNSAGTTSQAASSIVINATGVTLNNTTVSSIKIDPVRNDVANIAEVVMYNTTSKEVTYGNTISVAGNITASYNIATTALKTTPTTVAALPAAATAGAGARSFVSDANDTAFNAVVAGGSANNIPVFSDGTTWRIG